MLRKLEFPSYLHKQTMSFFRVQRILAVETKVANDDTLWLMYWIVYCSFGFIEYVAYSFFQTLPFYWLLKCIFLVWLMMPGATGGSYILYHRFIRRLIKPSKTN